MDGRLDKDNLIRLLSSMNEIYDKAGYNDKANYSILKKAAMEYARLSEFHFSKSLFYTTL